MNAAKVVWLWEVTGGGHWRGVADTFGQAQEEAQKCMENGGMAAVVESARLALNRETMQREYAPTGRQCTGRLVNGRIEWSELGRAAPNPSVPNTCPNPRLAPLVPRSGAYRFVH